MSRFFQGLRPSLQDAAPVVASTTTGARPSRQIARHSFSIGSDYETWQSLVGNEMATRVTRKIAIQIPAIKRARDVFCGLGTLPLHAVNSVGEPVDHQLLIQPESLKGYTRSKTISDTIDDLYFNAESLWVVVLRDTTTDFPTVIDRPDYSKWHRDPESGEIKIDGRDDTNSADLIYFASSNDPMLVAGANTVKTLRLLEANAAKYSDGVLYEYFTGLDPAEAVPDDEEVDETETDVEIERFLNSWMARRRERKTAWIPEGIERHEVKQLTAEEMQLVSAREFSIAEVSRLTGISPNWLALNITSRTYINAQEERRDFLDFPASPYIHAIEERLSLNDCTPRGHQVKFNLDGFLRPNTKERYETYAIGLSNGFLTLDEIRELEDRPPLGDTNG
jgi:hypothetical protein